MRETRNQLIGYYLSSVDYVRKSSKNTKERALEITIAANYRSNVYNLSGIQSRTQQKEPLTQ